MRFIISVLGLIAISFAAHAQSEVAEADGREESAAAPAYFEDMKGGTKSGVPRVIRNLSGVTEAFFMGLNESYVIPNDSNHNAFFYAIEEAQKKQRALSFRADPVSRHILAVDGVKGATAARKPVAEGGTPEEAPAPGPTPTIKHHYNKRADPRKATTTTGWID